MFKNVTALIKQAYEALIIIAILLLNSIYLLPFSINQIIDGFHKLNQWTGVNSKRIVAYSYFYREEICI